ncbi:MAG TPA: hypothetical protein VGJ60_20395 [Chloroflexota bacterium]
MGWSPVPTLAVLFVIWFVLCGLLAWGLSRWFRWVRGDFDSPSDRRYPPH